MSNKTKDSEEILTNEEFQELIPHLEFKDLMAIEIKTKTYWTKLFEIVHKEHVRCNLCEEKPILFMKAIKVHLKGERHINFLNGVKKFFHPIYTCQKDDDEETKSLKVSRMQTADSSSVESKALVRNSDMGKHYSGIASHKTTGRNYTNRKVLYLQFDELIHVKCHAGWKPFALVSDTQAYDLRCNLCQKTPKEFNIHLRSKLHMTRVSKLNDLVLENKPEVNKHVLIQIASQSSYSKECERILKNLLVKTEARKPYLMSLFCEMKLDDFFKLEYLVKPNKWKKLFTPMEGNKPIKCELCQKSLILKASRLHCTSKRHRLLQLETPKIRHPDFKDLSKSWSFCVGTEYKVKISIKARKKYKPLVEQEMNKLKKFRDFPTEKRCDATTVFNYDDLTDEEDDMYDDILDVSEDDMDNDLDKMVDEGSMNFESDIASENVHQANLEQYPRHDSKTATSEAKKYNPHVHENEVHRKMSYSDDYKSDMSADEALIGVEYVVKIIKSHNDPTPMYECCLCEVLLNEQRMEGHLTGYNHRYKYCEMHYTTAFKKYLASLSGMKYFDMFRVMGPILAKMAFEIETYHGRSIPYVTLAYEFKKKRPEIIAQLYCAKHASELYGPSFTNLFTEMDIERLIANIDNYVAPNNKKNLISRFVTVPQGQYYCTQKVVENVVRPESRWSKEQSTVAHPRGSRSPSHRNAKSEANNVSDDVRADHTDDNVCVPLNIWKSYRQQILISTAEVQRAYKEYRQCPENHPQYDQEWSKFWARRKDELISEGIDHRSYNYQAEWVSYFKNRIEGLFEEALEKAKFDIHKRLNIPLDAVDDKDTDNHHSSQDIYSVQQRKDAVRSQINIQDNKSEPPMKRHRVDTEHLVMQWNSQTKHTQSLLQKHSSTTLKNTENEIVSTIGRPMDNKPDVIHVLRLMCAFEDLLGSLGPKITDLLFMTLSMEKTLPNDTKLLEKRVLTPNNCSLLETAMEKLKGTLYAGLLDKVKEPGLNQAISLTSNLLNHAMQWNTERSVETDNSITNRDMKTNINLTPSILNASTRSQLNNNPSASNMNSAQMYHQSFGNNIYNDNVPPASSSNTKNDHRFNGSGFIRDNNHNFGISNDIDIGSSISSSLNMTGVTGRNNNNNTDHTNSNRRYSYNNTRGTAKGYSGNWKTNTTSHYLQKSGKGTWRQQVANFNKLCGGSKKKNAQTKY